MKRYVLIIIILLILIAIGCIVVINENKNQNNINKIQNEQVITEIQNEANAEINNEINNEIKDVIENKVDVETEPEIENEYVEVEYKEFTKDVIDNLNPDETIEISEAIDNKDGTVLIIFRKYVEEDVPELTDEEYDLLMKNKEIELFGEKFVLKYDTLLTNDNYVSFELDENNNLIPYVSTGFYKGTDEYYAKTVSSEFEIKLLPDDSSRNILEETSKPRKGNYINIGTFWEYIFDENDNLIHAEITW